MPSDDIHPHVLDDAPSASYLFLSDSLPSTRAAVEHSLATDAETRFLLAERVLPALRDELLTACRLQELCDDGAASVRKLSARGSVETAAAFDDVLRLATPTAADHTDAPFVAITDGDTLDRLAAAYDARYEASQPVTDRFAPVGWHAFLDAVEERFGAAFRADLETATDNATAVGTRRSPVSLAGLLCLVAAAHDCEQKALARFVEGESLLSEATVSNRVRGLDAAGLVDREDVSVSRPGRPPKQLALADDGLAPAGFAEALRTTDF